MLQRRAQLHEILPNGPLGDQTLLLLEMFDHPGQVPGVRQLQHDVQLVVLDEGGEVFDDVGVVKLLQELNLLHAVQPRLAVHHLEDLHLLEGDGPVIVRGPGAVHHAELALTDLAVDAEVLRWEGFDILVNLTESNQMIILTKLSEDVLQEKN